MALLVNSKSSTNRLHDGMCRSYVQLQRYALDFSGSHEDSWIIREQESKASVEEFKSTQRRSGVRRSAIADARNPTKE